MNEQAAIPLEPTPSVPLAPLAIINGQAVVDLPKDLYIPPEAMKVFLEAFEGPLDFLLYLIRKQNIDILDIPIATVTAQYIEYINLMQELSLELAAEYLVMAAILAEIKSRMLLPKVTDENNNEEDPRAELIRRLQEYERFKKAAEEIEQFPRVERDIFTVKADPSAITVERPLPQVNLPDLVQALMDVLKRAELLSSHHVFLETLTVREKMTLILTKVQEQEHCLFTGLFDVNEGRYGVVVTFLAMLELLKQSLIEFVQSAAWAPIYLKAKIKEVL